MKSYVAIGLTVLFLVAVVVEWSAYRAASAAPASASASQIYIHGTPVCVFRHGESIVARVGECGAWAAPGDAGPPDGSADSWGAGPALPPGHPPVGPDMLPDGAGRRILI